MRYHAGTRPSCLQPAFCEKLEQLYDRILKEPVPAAFTELLGKLK